MGDTHRSDYVLRVSKPDLSGLVPPVRVPVRVIGAVNPAAELYPRQVRTEAFIN